MGFHLSTRMSTGFSTEPFSLHSASAERLRFGGGGDEVDGIVRPVSALTNRTPTTQLPRGDQK